MLLIYENKGSNLGKLKGTRKIPLSDFGSDGDKL